MPTREEKINYIKQAIENGTYDWDAAIKGAADVIVDHPEVLLWR